MFCITEKGCHLYGAYLVLPDTQSGSDCTRQGIWSAVIWLKENLMLELVAGNKLIQQELLNINDLSAQAH